jgi:hypothetical protein
MTDETTAPPNDGDEYYTPSYGPWPLIAMLLFWGGVAVLASTAVIQVFNLPQYPTFAGISMMAVGLALASYMNQ